MSIVPNVPGESSPDSGKDLPDATTTSIEKLPKRFEYVEPPKNDKRTRNLAIVGTTLVTLVAVSITVPVVMLKSGTSVTNDTEVITGSTMTSAKTTMTSVESIQTTMTSVESTTMKNEVENCTTSFPCGLGVANCDLHDQCQTGLMCDTINDCSSNYGLNYSVACCQRGEFVITIGAGWMDSSNQVSTHQSWKVYDSASTDDCENACKLKSGCVGFTFVSTIGRCDLKDIQQAVTLQEGIPATIISGSIKFQLCCPTLNITIGSIGNLTFLEGIYNNAGYVSPMSMEYWVGPTGEYALWYMHAPHQLDSKYIWLIGPISNVGSFTSYMYANSSVLENKCPNNEEGYTWNWNYWNSGIGTWNLGIGTWNSTSDFSIKCLNTEF